MDDKGIGQYLIEPNPDNHPYQVLLLGDNTPECYDFEDEMRICEEDDSMDWWESKKPLEVIDAIKEMHNRYNEDSGWTWADDENAKEQQKPLKRLLAYANRQYQKHYAN